MSKLLRITGVAVALSTACNYDEGACWLDGQGDGAIGSGGGPIVPGTGGYGDVPPTPQDASGPTPPDCNIVRDSLCNENCLTKYEAAAAECAKIEIEAQRTACQDNAYAAYKQCRAACASDPVEQCKKLCDKINEDCIARCPKGDKGCMNECNQQNGKCLKDCEK